MDKFKINENNGNYVFDSEVSAAEIVKLALQIAEKEIFDRKSFTTVEDTSDYLRTYLMDKSQEVFGVMFLSSQHELISTEIMFHGTINSAAVYPREIIKQALLLGASAVIVFHNHPSGNPEPSRADKNITALIKDALALIDVPLLDHFVVGKAGAVSFAQRGLL